MLASEATDVPGLSIFSSLTITRPARISACARSRDGTRPRSSSNLSSLSFIMCPAPNTMLVVAGHGIEEGIRVAVHPRICGDLADGTHTRMCKLLLLQ